jgi:site-specific DNA-cytosine methylase
LRLNPVSFGMPTDRERIYVVMIRRDVLHDGATEAQIRKHITRTVTSIEHEAAFDFQALMFPDSHPAVQAFMKDARPSLKCDGKCSCNGDLEKGAAADFKKVPNASVLCKWRHTHYDHMVAKGLDIVKVAQLAAKTMAPDITTPRIQHCIAIKVLESKGKGETPGILNASQSPSYATVHATTVPCITPNSVLFVPKRNRSLIPEEKLIYQCFPMHKLDVGCNSTRELAEIAGNSMNVRCVFVAILAGLSVVDKAKTDKVLHNLLNKAPQTRCG